MENLRSIHIHNVVFYLLYYNQLAKQIHELWDIHQCPYANQNKVQSTIMTIK